MNTIPFYRPNPTDTQQTKIEESDYQSGIPVDANKKTRIIQRGRQGAPFKTANAGFDFRLNAGVIMNNDDKANYNMEALIGKR